MIVIPEAKCITSFCGDCQYWNRRNDRALSGECRRDAPRPSGIFSVFKYWPLTDDIDWCGEFVKQIDTKEIE